MIIVIRDCVNSVPAECIAGYYLSTASIETQIRVHCEQTFQSEHKSVLDSDSPVQKGSAQSSFPTKLNTGCSKLRSLFHANIIESLFKVNDGMRSDFV